MNLVWTTAIGFIAGVIARLITPGKKEASGFLLTAIVGVMGSFAGAYLGQEGGWYDAGGLAAIMGAVVGAVVVLAVWSLLFRRRSKSWL